jgi:hypothetical protein
MAFYQPFQIECFHSCDREIGIKVLNGKVNLNPSNNPWDWLGPGIYFWELNPKRALQYAKENAAGIQFNRFRIKEPFVLGAIIEFGNCLNLVDTESIEILEKGYNELVNLVATTGAKLPINRGSSRMLDCAVIKYIHQTRKLQNLQPFDSIRSSFIEGDEVYPTSSFSKRSHIQVCVLNENIIKGYFLPRPVKSYNQ